MAGRIADAPLGVRQRGSATRLSDLCGGQQVRTNKVLLMSGPIRSRHLQVNRWSTVARNHL